MLASFSSVLASPVVFRGIGLHSGAPASARVLPAPSGSGVVFRRSDLPGRPVLATRADATGSLAFCTTLRGQDGAEIGTVEHLMAALAALSIDDALIEVDGPEVPILDGSSVRFLAGLRAAGLHRSMVRRRYIEVVRPIEIVDGDRLVRLEPWSGRAMSLEIDFPHSAIGRSSLDVDLAQDGAFDALLAPARTFTLLSDVERLRSMGLARGGSLDNAVVVGDEGVMNPGGLRFPDEFIRHKALDVVGDMALAGAPVLGRYVGHRAGHALNNALVRALLADRGAWRWAFAPASDTIRVAA